MAEAWEQQRDESPQAFQAFAAFRDQGAQRTLAKTGRDLGKSGTLMKRWAGRWDWWARAESWDREQDRQWRAEQRAARREVARRHARIAAAFQSKIVARLNSLKADELSPADLVRWLDIAARIERQAYEMDSEAAKDSAPAEVRSMLRDLMAGIRGAHGR